jgi:hypothetical protein
MKSHVAMFAATLGVAFLALNPAVSQAAPMSGQLVSPALQSGGPDKAEQVNYYGHRRHWRHRSYGYGHHYGYNSYYSPYNSYSYYGSPGISLFLGGGHRRHHRGW